MVELLSALIGQKRWAVAVFCGLLLAQPAAAEEWHEAYRAGLSALESGDHLQAAERLRRAIALRARPGRNVVIYGTNVEPRYYPYLHLAEALLALGQLDAAREALAASASWAREPADDRQKVSAQLDLAIARRRSTAKPETPVIATRSPTPPPVAVVETPPPPSTATRASPSPVPRPFPVRGRSTPRPDTPVERFPSPAAKMAARVQPSATPSATFPATLEPQAALVSERGGLPAFVAMALAVGLIAWIARQRPKRRAAEATPPDRLSPGAHRDELGQEWFGEYRLLEQLGRGGMASVYKAERGNERVALKRPLVGFLDDADFLRRFSREADINRSLNHPNIVRILERGEVEAVPYFTMELLAGETLQAFIRHPQPAEPRVAVSVVAQVAEALDFAHSKGVVHRDLKPSNIMLLPDGTAKVMDFGLARGTRFEGMTITGAFLGTPPYVAPEMIEGRGTEPRSDLYALGVVFYELLTGQAPFRGESPFAILQKHLTEEPSPPSRNMEWIPAELDAIVLRLLRKSAAERPSAEELVVTLREWLSEAT